MVEFQSYLRQVGMCQGLLRSDSLVRVNLQHLLQQVYRYRIGSLEHNTEILGRHLRKRVDVIFRL